MGILTLVRYLMGSREAIREIAVNRHALWIGLLFVLSAGFAREYDGEDLLHEPWYVLIPVGASLGTSILLYFVAYSIANAKGATGQEFLPDYLSFLGLFWMTAPLAWLYAIPYEQFLSPGDAMRANLATLGLVAAWRVALMMRVLPVVLPFSHLQAFFLVLSFGTVVMLALMLFLPVPLIDVMGGIRLSERDQVMRLTALAVGQLGCMSLPVWLIGLLVVLAMPAPAWQPVEPNNGSAASLALLAVASLAIWPLVLPHTQPPQQRRREVEKLFAREEVAEALAEMSRHAQADYPPGWEPPPRQFSLLLQREEVLEVLEELAKGESADWVREYYLDRVTRAFRGEFHVDDESLRRFGVAIGRIPGGYEAADRGLEWLRDHYTPEYFERTRRLLRGEPAVEAGKR